MNTLRKLPNYLGLPRVAIIGGGGCGNTTLMQRVAVPTLRTFFQTVLVTAPSNRAARGLDPSANTLHSAAGLKPQDSMRTSSLHIKSDQMRKRMEANQTHAGAWVHDEALQTSATRCAMGHTEMYPYAGGSLHILRSLSLYSDLPFLLWKSMNLIDVVSPETFVKLS